MNVRNELSSAASGLLWSAAAGLLVVATLQVAVVAQAKPPVGQGEEKVAPKTVEPSSASAFDGQAALRSAAGLAKKVVGLRGEPRRHAMRAALQAYQKITSAAGSDTVTAARAWFEAAELQRRLGDTASALAGYSKAATLDQGRFTARAGIARAHLLRRSAKLEDALEAYRLVAGIKPSSGRAHEARLGVARCLVDSGDMAAAESAFRTLIDKAPTVVRRIDACNRLAQLQIKQGALDAAAVTIASADAAVGRAVGKDIERAKKAAAKMSSKRALQRARDKNNGAAKDAAELDAERSKARVKK